MDGHTSELPQEASFSRRWSWKSVTWVTDGCDEKIGGVGRHSRKS